MIDTIIPFDIFQNVVFKYCFCYEQIILQKMLYGGKLNITSYANPLYYDVFVKISREKLKNN